MDLRKLDALVAEHVMAYQPIHILGQIAIQYRITEAGYFNIRGNPQKAPHYSTDIASAWEVVENLDGQWTVQGQHFIGWEVSLVEASMREDRYENPFKAMSKTAPIAICLAALKAKGVDVSEWEI